MTPYDIEVKGEGHCYVSYWYEENVWTTNPWQGCWSWL